ncbi:MAG: hypothetical protein ACRC3Z_08915 [Phocaeicola sp.]
MLVRCNDLTQVEADASSVPGIASTQVSRCSPPELMAEFLLKPNNLGVINRGVDKHFYSKGAFNLIQLVLYLLKQTGPAHLFISSYSISEESLSTLLRYRNQGDILSMRFLIDNRVRTISPKPFDFLVTSFPDAYRCCALHAKVALIYNDNYTLSVVGSQNATHNPKLERGIIHTSSDIFEFDLKMLTDEFNSGST